eukprot:186178_1
MGTLYISRQYICFYSTGFWKQAVTIPMGDVVNVSRKRTLKHNAIKFYVNGAGYPKNGYVFTRFWKTADAFDIIKRIVCCPHSLAQAGSVESSSVRESEDDALSVFDAEPYKPGESLPESLDEHFTELDKIEMMEINALDFPVSSDQLFEQCFSQKDGLYAKFLEDGGCSSMNITEWRKCDKCGTCRSQDYTTPIGDMPGFVQNILKTNSTSVTALDRLRRSVDRFIICSLIDTPDIPYGTSFHVYRMFDVKDTGPNSCHMVISCGIEFVKRVSFIGSVITKKNKEGYTENSKKMHSFFMENFKIPNGTSSSGRRKKRPKTQPVSQAQPSRVDSVPIPRAESGSSEVRLDSFLRIWMTLLLILLGFLVLQIYLLRSNLNDISGAIRNIECRPGSVT